MRTFKVLLVFTLLSLFALTAFAARGSIDWCGPDQCRSGRGAAAVLQDNDEASETLAVTIDNEQEEVLAVYEEESETMDAKKKGKEEPSYTTPTGNQYECKSDCRALFASSSCERCTYPFAYYNKQVSKYTKCFNDMADLKSLSVKEKEQTKQMCITDGLCTCQPWERLDAYMANSCAFQCGWLGNFGTYRGGVKKNKGGVVYIPKKDGACPTKKNYIKFFGGKSYKIPVVSYCQSGAYTKAWLMNYYDLTRTFNWNAALSNDVIDVKTKKPNKVALKPIGNFASAGLSEKLYFDTEGKLLAANGWKLILYIHKATRELTFEKTYKLNKVNGKTHKEYITEALNAANNDGFNNANADAKGFTSRVTIDKNFVAVTFTLKIETKSYTAPFKKGCSAIDAEFTAALKTDTVPANPAIPADVLLFIKSVVPALITKNQAIAEYLKTKNFKLIEHVGQHKYSNNFKSQRIYLNVDFTKTGVKPSFEFAAYSQEVLDELSSALLAKINSSWVLSTSQD